MSNVAQKQFLANVQKEIKQKVKTENKTLDKINNETDELKVAIKGYTNYFNELEHFIIESMQDFTLAEEDVPTYFKSNINEVYRNYVKVKKDAIKEIETLNQYINHCKREIKNNQRSLKFYKSHYKDSDFFTECKPLVNIFQEKISVYEENIKLTEETIEILRKIVKKLEKWE